MRGLEYHTFSNPILEVVGGDEKKVGEIWSLQKLNRKRKRKAAVLVNSLQGRKDLNTVSRNLFVAREN